MQSGDSLHSTIIIYMIPGLDGLRAIAFLTLLSMHTKNGTFGWMGVQLFFVLSGFLITGILVRMKETLSAKQYFLKFYGRRFLRIFPLYFSYLFILSIAIKFNNWIPSETLKGELFQHVQPQLSYAYFYVYDFFHVSSEFQTTRFLSHLWSLSVEEQFYIFWPLILFFTPKEKITIILGPLLRTLIYLMYSNHLLFAPSDDPYTAVYVLPFSHVDAFAMGGYISCFQIPNSRKQLMVLSFIIPLLGYISQYFTAGVIQFDSLGYEFALFTGYKFIWGYSILNYFFALLIYAVSQTKLLTNILEHFIFRYIGRISYGLYVYHYPVLGLFIMLQPLYWDQAHQLMLGDIRVYFIILIITIIIASISFYLFEKPINNLKDRLFPLE